MAHLPGLVVVVVCHILPGLCSLESMPPHAEGVLTICRGDIVSLICSHNNLNSGATRWTVGPTVNCAITTFHNSVDRESCGPFTFQDMSKSSQTTIKSMSTVEADASIDGVVVECRDNPGSPSTLIGRISICVVDEPPVPNNITIAFSDVMNISWNVLGHESCRFTFHVAIRTANDQTERRNVTQKTFALFFNLQPNDYIISVTVHAGSCASNPVNMVFTVSGSLTKDSGVPMWWIPVVAISFGVIIPLMVTAVVVIVSVQIKIYFKVHREARTKQLEQPKLMEEVELSGVECHEEPHCDTIPKTLKPIELCGEISTESFDQLMRRIQVLQYNLKYEELKQCTISLMDSRNIDLKIMGMLTETTGCTFRGDLAEGIKLTDLALKLCDSSACMNGQILRTRVFYVKSSLYRNQGDGQRAQQYLDDAVAGSCGITSFFDSSIVAYQRACVYVEQGNVDKAKECFVRAIEDSRSLSAVYLPIIQQKASIGLALAYLGCSKYYPQMPEQISGDCTSHHDMESAWTLLYNMDTEAMPERTKVELHIANSILFYKKKMTTKAIHQAQCAIRICAACNVRGEMEKSARELLNHMQPEPVSEVS